MAQLVKTMAGLAIASVKTVNGLAIASVKTIAGLDNTSGGGGASAFVFSQSKSASDDGAAITSVTLDSSITAGQFVWVWVKWEGANGISAVTENGAALTALTQGNEASNDLHGRGFYRLSANGGGSAIALTWTGTATFCRVIVATFSYGGTASFVAESAYPGSGVGTGVNENPASSAITNSGSFRLNLSGYAAYGSPTVDTKSIGGSAATFAPATQVADAWSWYNDVNLSSQSSNATLSGGINWVLALHSFAAN